MSEAAAGSGSIAISAGARALSVAQARLQPGAPRGYIQGAQMIAKITGTVLLSLVVFVVVSLLVSLGVVWLTGGVLRGAVIGIVCGLAAAFVISTVSIAAQRNEGRPRRRAGARSGGPEDEDDQRG